MMLCASWPWKVEPPDLDDLADSVDAWRAEEEEEEEEEDTAARRARQVVGRRAVAAAAAAGAAAQRWPRPGGVLPASRDIGGVDRLILGSVRVGARSGAGEGYVDRMPWQLGQLAVFFFFFFPFLFSFFSCSCFLSSVGRRGCPGIVDLSLPRTGVLDAADEKKKNKKARRSEEGPAVLKFRPLVMYRQGCRARPTDGGTLHWLFRQSA